MNDNDLRALAAKLLKHYVADQNPVAEELVAQIPLDRMPAKVVPLITAEQRALLDQLGGAWASTHEGKAVALIAQGCGGCGGGGDGGGGDGGDGGDGDGGDGGDDDGESGDPGLGDPGLSTASLDSFSDQQDAISSMMNSLNESLSNQDAPADPSMSEQAMSLTTSVSPETQAMVDALTAAQAPDVAPDVTTTPDTTATTSSVLGSLGSALGEMFGVSSAQAAPAGPATSGVADVISAATAAANNGQLSEFLAANNTAAQVLAGSPAGLAGLQATNNSVLEAQGQQSIYGSQPGLALDQNANVYGQLGPGPTTSIAAATPSSGPYGTLGMSPEQAQQAELTGQIAAIGAGPNAAGFTAAPGAPSSTQTAPAAPEAPAAPAAPSQVAAAPSLAPESPTTSLTISPSSQPTAMSSTSTQPSYTGIDAIDSRISNAINNPGTTALNIAVGMAPGLGIANSLSGLLGGPTVGGALAGLASGATGAAPGSTADAIGSGGGGDSSGGITRPLPTSTGSQGIDLNTFDPTSLPTATSPVETTNAALRRYLGLTGDPTKYGFGAQQQFYAAKGGMFDANQYFADGGMVQPLSPPTTPLISAQPTMAFTDGAGAVGSIAQPPGLAPSDAYGSDAPHASPMAPSVAAAVPTMQPGLATLAVPNVNASPVTSQVSQNPNVGYALGNSPLSNLTRS